MDLHLPNEPQSDWANFFFGFFSFVWGEFSVFGIRTFCFFIISFILTTIKLFCTETLADLMSSNLVVAPTFFSLSLERKKEMNQAVSQEAKE